MSNIRVLQGEQSSRAGIGLVIREEQGTVAVFGVSSNIISD